MAMKQLSYNTVNLKSVLGGFGFFCSCTEQKYEKYEKEDQLQVPALAYNAHCDRNKTDV